MVLPNFLNQYPSLTFDAAAVHPDAVRTASVRMKRRYVKEAHVAQLNKDSYITINNSSILSGSAVTVALWCYVDGAPATERNIVGSQAYGVQLKLKPYTYDAYAFSVRYSESVYKTINGGTLKKGWHCLVGRLSNNTTELLLDLNAVNSAPFSQTVETFSTPLYFGKVDTTASVEGKIKHVQFYNRALTDDELLDYYTTQGDVAFSGCSAWYPLTGSIVDVAGTTTNNGTGNLMTYTVLPNATDSSSAYEDDWHTITQYLVEDGIGDINRGVDDQAWITGVFKNASIDLEFDNSYRKFNDRADHASLWYNSASLYYIPNTLIEVNLGYKMPTGTAIYPTTPAFSGLIKGDSLQYTNHSTCRMAVLSKLEYLTSINIASVLSPRKTTKGSGMAIVERIYDYINKYAPSALSLTVAANSPRSDVMYENVEDIKTNAYEFISSFARQTGSLFGIDRHDRIFLTYYNNPYSMQKGKLPSDSATVALYTCEEPSETASLIDYTGYHSLNYSGAGMDIGYFNGSTSAIIMTNTLFIELAEGYTVVTRVQPSLVLSSTIYELASGLDSGVLRMESNSTTTGIKLYITNDGLTVSSQIISSVIEQNTFTSVALRHTPIDCGVFKNGVAIASVTGLIYPDERNRNSSFVGKSNAGSYFNGAISDFQVYSRPLSDDEIYGLAADSLGAFCLSSCIVWYRFKHDAYDYSGSGNHGTASNVIFTETAASPDSYFASVTSGKFGAGGRSFKIPALTISAICQVSGDIMLPPEFPENLYQPGMANFSSSTSKVALPYQSDLHLADGGALSAWIYPRTSGGSSQGVIIHKDNSHYSFRQYGDGGLILLTYDTPSYQTMMARFSHTSSRIIMYDRQGTRFNSGGSLVGWVYPRTNGGTSNGAIVYKPGAWDVSIYGNNQLRLQIHQSLSFQTSVAVFGGTTTSKITLADTSTTRMSYGGGFSFWVKPSSYGLYEQGALLYKSNYAYELVFFSSTGLRLWINHWADLQSACAVMSGSSARISMADTPSARLYNGGAISGWLLPHTSGSASIGGIVVKGEDCYGIYSGANNTLELKLSGGQNAQNSLVANFSATTSKIVCPDSQLANRLVGEGAISMWVKPRSSGASGARFIDKYPGYVLSLQNGTIRWEVNGSTAAASLPDQLLFNQWNHLVVSFSTTGGTLFFNNGVQLAGVSCSVMPPNASNPLIIGNHVTLDRHYDGEMRNLQMYNRVLNLSEVVDLYHAGDTYCLYGCTAWWKLDGNATALTGSVNGSITSVGWTSNTAINFTVKTITSAVNALKYGEWNHFVVLLQDTGHQIYINNSLSASSPVTALPINVEAPLCLGNAPTTTANFSGKLRNIQLFNRALSANEVTLLYEGKDSYSPSGCVAWYPLDSSTVDIIGSNHGSGTSISWAANASYKSTYYSVDTTPGSLTLNAWHHIAVSFQDNGHNIYVDNVNRTKDLVTALPFDTAGALILGNNSASVGFAGAMRNLQFYARTLTAADVQQLYLGADTTTVASCVSWYPMNGNADNAVTVNHGSATGMTYQSNSASYEAVWVVNTDFSITSLNKWNHFAVILNPVEGHKIYINNVLRTASTITATPFNTATLTYIGNRDVNGYNIDGNLRNMQFYNRPKTASEVAVLYRTHTDDETVASITAWLPLNGSHFAVDEIITTVVSTYSVQWAYFTGGASVVGVPSIGSSVFGSGLSILGRARRDGLAASGISTLLHFSSADGTSTSHIYLAVNSTTGLANFQIETISLPAGGTGTLTSVYAVFNGSTTAMGVGAVNADWSSGFTWAGDIKSRQGYTLGTLLWVGSSSAANTFIQVAQNSNPSTLQFNICNAGSSSVVTVDNVFAASVSAHIALVANGSLTILYKNGVVLTSVAQTIVPAAVNHLGAYLGRQQWGTPTEHWRGEMRNVQLYNRALVASEVSLLYSDTSMTTTFVNLIAHWKFNSVTTDYSTAGTLNGSATSLAYNVYYSAGTTTAGAPPSITTLIADGLFPLSTSVSFAVCLDGSMCSLYKDGVLYTATAMPAPGAAVRAFNHIGNSEWGDQCWYGGLSNLQIYDRSLSESEVVMFVNRPSAPVSFPNLVAWWKFNSTTVDYSTVTGGLNGSATSLTYTTSYIVGTFTVAVGGTTTLTAIDWLSCGVNAVTTYTVTAPNSSVVFNQWNHVAGVIAFTGYKIYVNGVDVTVGDTAGLPANTASTVYIGNVAQNTHAFNGYMRNVQFYDRALSADEALGLANDTTDSINFSNLVCWYRLNGDATDYTGMHYDGVPTAIGWLSNNAYAPTYGTTLVYQTLVAYFNTGISYFVASSPFSFGDVLSVRFKISGDWSGTAMVPASTEGAWYRFISKGGINSGSSWMIQRHYNPNAGLYARLDTSDKNNQGVCENPHALDNVAHDCVYIFNSGTTKVYMDGRLISTAKYCHGTGFGNTEPLYFSRTEFGSLGAAFYLWNVQFYHKELSQSEVTYLYEGDDLTVLSDCVAWYRLTGDASDWQAAHHGTVTNISYPSNPVATLTVFPYASENYTFEAVLKFNRIYTSKDVAQCLWVRDRFYGSRGNNNLIRIGFDGDKKSLGINPKARYNPGDTNVITEPFGEEQWYYLVARNDGAHRELFLNGNLLYSSDKEGVPVAGLNLQIGLDAYKTDFEIDSMRISNIARTEDEIKETTARVFGSDITAQNTGVAYHFYNYGRKANIYELVSYDEGYTRVYNTVIIPNNETNVFHTQFFIDGSWETITNMLVNIGNSVLTYTCITETTNTDIKAWINNSFEKISCSLSTVDNLFVIKASGYSSDEMRSSYIKFVTVETNTYIPPMLNAPIQFTGAGGNELNFIRFDSQDRYVFTDDHSIYEFGVREYTLEDKDAFKTTLSQAAFIAKAVLANNKSPKIRMTIRARLLEGNLQLLDKVRVHWRGGYTHNGVVGKWDEGGMLEYANLSGKITWSEKDFIVIGITQSDNDNLATYILKE